MKERNADVYNYVFTERIFNYLIKPLVKIIFKKLTAPVPILNWKGFLRSLNKVIKVSRGNWKTEEKGVKRRKWKN